MSAPSAGHEDRRLTLDTVATLAGFVVPWRLAPGLRPDVARVDPGRLTLFVGEAKDTETPGCRETFARLVTYARAAAGWRERGFGVVVAIGHASPWLAADWLRTLTAACQLAGLGAHAEGVVQVDEALVVAWLAVPSPALAAPVRAVEETPKVLSHRAPAM